MSVDATALEEGYQPDPGEKMRLLTFDMLDGRTRAVVRVRSAEKQLEADLGEDLSAAQYSLIRRACVLSAILEDVESKWAKGDPLPLDEYLAATNTLRRVLATLGLERRAKAVNGLPTLLGKRQ